MKKINLYFLLSVLFFCGPAVSNAEDTVLLKGGVSMNASTDSELSAEESEHEGKINAINSAERGLDASHKSKIEAIEKQDSDVKSLQIADEKEKYQKQKKDLERKRALEEKRHAERMAAAGSGDIAGRLMKLAGEMDRITTDMQNNAMAAGNQFVGGLSDTVSKTARFMAQKPGTVAPQIADAVITYLSNDYNANDQMLYDAAVKAVDDMQKNPARFLGEHALEIAAGAAGATAEMAEARAVASATEIGTAAEMTTAAEELGSAGKMNSGASKARDAEQRAQAAKKMRDEQMKAQAQRQYKEQAQAKEAEKTAARTAAKAREDKLRLQAEQQHREKLRKKTAEDNRKRHSEQANKRKQDFDRMNQQKRREQAKKLEDAARILQRMMENAREFSNFQDAASIVKKLKNDFGGGKAKNPFHDGAQGLKSHQEGIPIRSSQKKIESALQAAGENSEGLVFVDQGPGTPYHMFKVKNSGGRIEWQGLDVNSWKRIFFYRTN